MELKLDRNRPYALALAGGGARGAYEIGVWDALVQAGISITAVSGTSIGAMNGAFVATGELQRAKEIWKQLSYRDVMDADPVILDKLSKKDLSDLDLKQAAEFFRQAIQGKGLNIDPMRETMRRVIDEKKVRESTLAYYIVTCSVDDKKELELRASDIPEGELYDMLLASAYLPVFRNEKLGGKRYLDGGFMDVMPVHVLVENGYRDIIGVSCNAVGVKRKVDLPEGTNFYEVSPRVYIGTVMEFDPKQSEQNLRTGYYDGMRLLYGLAGKDYYIDRSYSEENAYSLLLTFTETFLSSSGSKATLREINEKILPKIASRAKAGGNDYYDLLISALEVAAKEAGIDPMQIYTEDELIARVLACYPLSDGVLPRGLQSRLLTFLEDNFG